MIEKSLGIAEKVVKIAIGVGKLAAKGGLSLDAAKTAIDMLKDGRSLYAGFDTEEARLAREIVGSVARRIEEAEADPEIGKGIAHDLRARLDQALDHCVPEPKALQTLLLDSHLDAAAGAGAVIAVMRARLLDAGPRHLTAYYADPGSNDARFFEAVLHTALRRYLDDKAYFGKLERAIAGRTLAGLDAIKGAQADQNARLDRMLALLETHGNTAAAEAAGVQREAVVSLARRIVSTVEDFDQALAELERAVEIAIEVRRAGAHGSNLSAFVDDVLHRLADLTAAGRFDEAGQEADAAIARWERDEAERRERADAELVRLLEAGERQDLLRGDPEAAAAKIVRRVALEVSEDGRLEALRRVQDDWCVRGRDRGLNLDLKVAIALARAVLATAEGADQRGAGLNVLGIALKSLGERESGTETLREAVHAYRAALDERTRDRVPRGWAMIQHNLGAALKALGDRESGTETLREAVTAYRAALEERTRDRVPLDWAMTQTNLGNALTSLGERERGTETLGRAVAAYRAALEENTRDRVPLDWAMTQNNLSSTLRALAQRESGTERLSAAVDASRAALQIWTRDRVPLLWAMAQINLGNALAGLAERESGTEALREAVAAYRAALEENTRDRVPLDWATTQSNLGNALTHLGEREDGIETLREAVKACRAALEECTRDRAPFHWAGIQTNLGNALQTLGKRESGTKSLREAIAAYRAVLDEYTRKRVPLRWALSTGNQGVAMALLAERTGDRAMADAAVAQIAAARDVMREASHASLADDYEAHLARATALLHRLSQR